MGAPCWCCRGVNTKVKGLVRPPKLTVTWKKNLKMENWGSKSKGKCSVQMHEGSQTQRYLWGLWTVTEGKGREESRAEQREQQKEKPDVVVSNSQSHQPESIPALMTGWNPLECSVAPLSVFPLCNTDLARVTLYLPDSSEGGELKAVGFSIPNTSALGL